MKQLVILFSLAVPHVVAAQQKGIAFENRLTWQQVLQKAKTENKYIFLDCYASWCSPCKWMDHQVYNDDKVGKFVNTSFISVRLQMDTTDHDDSNRKDWYRIAHEMNEQYRIGVYPTYLFFSSDGMILHKAVGAVDAENFLALAKAAMDPYTQYYTLLKQYRQGIARFDRMAYLINTAKLYDDSLSSGIAVNYLHYLGELTDKELWTKDKIKFLDAYVEYIHYEDKLFQRFLHEQVQIDSTMGTANYANRLISTVAYNEEVLPKIDAAINALSEPNWYLMRRTISKKYGPKFIKTNLLAGKVEYYRKTRKWGKYAKYFVIDMQNANIKNWPIGQATSLGLNNNAMEVFRYSKRKKELEEALSWINKALPMNFYQVQELDTKANLLYKLGRTNEAITLEKKALGLAPRNNDIQQDLEKMTKGQATW